MSNPDINWIGKSGEKYGYWIHKIDTTFNDEPGNYIYAKRNSDNRWVAVYIGQTSSLRDRLADHEKEGCALRNGATHIHAHTNSRGEQDRRDEERDLIKNYSSVCNDRQT